MRVEEKRNMIAFLVLLTIGVAVVSYIVGFFAGAKCGMKKTLEKYITTTK
jgi:hypothetical protein